MLKKKLLILSDSPTLNTGLSRCVKEITSRLYDKYEIRVAGWHQSARAHNFPFHIYPVYKGIKDEYAQVETAITDFEPDILLAIGDIWDFFETARIILNWRAEHKNFSAILWLTVDGNNLHSSWVPIVQTFDAIATFSKYAQKKIKEFANIDTIVIYPGVDTNVFKVLGKEFTYSRTQLDPTKTFVCLSVSQNTDRKAIPLTLEAFAKFSEGKDDVFLIVATDPNDPHGYDLWDIIGKMKLSKKIALSRDCNPRTGMSDEKLNILYNIATALISTSIGEGYGLFFNEAMATGTIPIATNYTTPPEILADGRGLLIDVASFMYGAYGLRRAIISIDSLVSQLEILYKDWKGSRKLIGDMATKCSEYAKTLTWEKSVFGLDNLMDISQKQKARPWIHNTVNIKNVRLLTIIPSWGKHCGIAEYTKDLCAAFEETGKTVVVYPTNDLSDVVNYCKKTTSNVIHIQHEFSFFRNKNQLESIFHEFNNAGIKTVVTMHSFCPGLKSYNQILLDTADSVLFHSQLFINHMKQTNKCKDNIKFIPMGCKAKYPYNFDAVELTKQNLGIQKRHPIIGSFGFLRDQKGFQEIVLAIKKMKKEYPDICFLLVSPQHQFGSPVYDEEFFTCIDR